MDSAGSLFVADAGGRTLRRVNLGTGLLETVAGAAPRLGQPRGLALDSAGHLFVADALDETVRRLDLGTGEISVVAGSAGLPGGADGAVAQARFSGPAALAYLGPGRLAVADAFTIRLVDLQSGQTRSLAGRTPAPGSADGRGAAAAFRVPGALRSMPAVGSTSRTAPTRRFDDWISRPRSRRSPGRRVIRPRSTVWAPGRDRPAVGRGCRCRASLRRRSVGARRPQHRPGEWCRYDAGGRRGERKPGRSWTRRALLGPVALALDGAGHLFVADHPYQDESAEEEDDDDGDDDSLAGMLGRGRTGCSAIRRIDLATGAVVTIAGSGTREAESDGVALSARFDGPMGLPPATAATCTWPTGGRDGPGRRPVGRKGTHAGRST